MPPSTSLNRVHCLTCSPVHPLQVSPLSDWAVKYASYSEDTLGVEMVASYGRQVLEVGMDLSVCPD